MRTRMIALGAMALLLAACGGGEPVEPSKRGKQSSQPVETYRPALPDEYKDAKPPEGMDLTDPGVIERGRKSFMELRLGNCASCHGESGRGDGAAGVALNPKPADLTSSEFHDAVSDAYIYWRIETGAAGYDRRPISAMTGFPAAKGPEERWEVVAFVRSLRSK